MTPDEAATLLRRRLESRAAPNTFSFEFRSRAIDLRCVVEDGRTVGIELSPARETLRISFDRPDGIRVSVRAEEESLEILVETVVRTVVSTLERLSAKGAKTDSTVETNNAVETPR